MIKVVFFDINDTLLNHSKAQEKAINKMSNLLPKQNKSEFTKNWKKIAKKYWDFFEKGKMTFEDQQLQRITLVWNYFKIKLTPKQIDQYANNYTTYYEQALCLNPILEIFLELLRASNIPIGIISNGYGPLQRSRLKAAGIEPYLTNHLVFISGEVGVAKPDEKIFILAEKAIETYPSDIVFFGDDPKNYNPLRPRAVKNKIPFLLKTQKQYFVPQPCFFWFSSFSSLSG